MAMVHPSWSLDRPLRFATRGSPLARRQCDLVMAMLEAAVPGLSVSPLVVRTTGDRLVDIPLDRIGGQGVFTKEVQAAVLDGRADVAVHSAKDLPSTTPPGLCLAAIPERADPRDALIGRSLGDLVAGATVATGSARRRAQLANLRPDLTFVELRGNMATRVDRVAEGAVDAVVVAMAALDRLGWSDRATEVLSTSVMLPQAGQGALALECRADDAQVLGLLAAIDHAPTHRTVVAERAMLEAIGGNCSLPMAAWAETGLEIGDPAGDPSGDLDGDAAALRLHGMLASGDGRVLVRASLEGPDPVALGRDLGHLLVSEGGGSAIEGWDQEQGWDQGGEANDR